MLAATLGTVQTLQVESKFGFENRSKCTSF